MASLFSSSSLSLLLLLLFLSSSLASSIFPYCNTTCRYEQSVWSVLRYGETEIPESLWAHDVAAVGFDGDQAWYDKGCSALNIFGNSLGLCSSCRPRWVYLYRQQKRIISSLGKKESVFYLDFGYEPSEANWASYCSSLTLETPNFASSDENTLNFRSAHYLYASGASCYDRVFCSVTQSYNPMETAYNCDAHKYNGYPSFNYCGYDPTEPIEPYTLRMGCDAGGCGTVTVDLPNLTRKQSTAQYLAKSVQKGEKKKYVLPCEYTDSWYFPVKY